MSLESQTATRIWPSAPAPWLMVCIRMGTAQAHVSESFKCGSAAALQVKGIIVSPSLYAAADRGDMIADG